MQQQQQQKTQDYGIIQSWFPELGITDIPTQERFLREIDSFFKVYSFKVEKKSLPNWGLCFVFDGNIPYEYKGGKYSAPVNIYVTAGFPKVGPYCFLKDVQGVETNSNNPFIKDTRICHTEYGTNWNESKNLCDFAKSISNAFAKCTPFYATQSPKIASGELKLGNERSIESMSQRLDCYKTVSKEMGMSSFETVSIRTNLLRVKTDLENTQNDLSIYIENTNKIIGDCDNTVKDMKEKVGEMNRFVGSYKGEWGNLPAELVAVPFDDLSKQVIELTALVDAVDETIRMLINYVDNDPDKVLKKVKELSVQKYVAMHTLEKISKLK